MGIKTPRLYRKKSGIYWYRVLLNTSQAANSSGSADTTNLDSAGAKRARFSQSRTEIRRSLGTADAQLAHNLAARLNAVLAGTAQSAWSEAVSKFLSNPHLVSSWTITSQGISADGEDDQRRLDAFLRANPDIRKAVLYSIRSGMLNGPKAASNAHAVQDSGAIAHIALPSRLPPSSMAATPSNPLRMEEAILQFIERGDDRGNEARTTKDIARAVRGLVKYVSEHQPHLGSNPYMHQIETSHISEYISAQKNRPGRYKDKDGNQTLVSASTLKKRLIDLGGFFSYLHTELEACLVNPVGNLNDRLKDFGRKASRSKASYEPFSTAQIRHIFEPGPYLTHNRNPDYFWCPLLGAHLGGRLGEFVQLTTDDIQQDLAGVWYLTVREEVAKNQNSVRNIPLTQPLIDLGFLEYVAHVKQLGAKQLWPHRDLTTPTALDQPSKNQSDTFGRYLTKRDLVSTKLVYHSFRHTVVNALLDAKTPIHVSMHLCGHEVLEAAIERGMINESAARGVHLRNYSHADLPRLGESSPLQIMSEALETAVKLPIDYPRLKTAARIVLQHTRKVGEGFETGWPAQRTKYTEMQVARLGDKNT